MPDHPSLLQTYVWQGLDIAPKFPTPHKFLDFWESSLDGRLHSVRVASAKLIPTASATHAPSCASADHPPAQGTVTHWSAMPAELRICE